MSDIGHSEERLGDFNIWAEDLLSNWSNDFSKSTERIIGSQKEMDEYLGSIITQRRAKPESDLISMLVLSEDGKDFLNDEEITTLIETLVIAGLDTVHHQLGIMLVMLLDNPNIWTDFVSSTQNRKNN